MCSSRSLWSQVKWETGVLRQAFFSPMEYVVLATDYTSKALVCSCQDLSVAGFGGLNRRSCDFLVVSVFQPQEWLDRRHLTPSFSEGMILLSFPKSMSPSWTRWVVVEGQHTGEVSDQPEFRWILTWPWT